MKWARAAGQLSYHTSGENGNCFSLYPVNRTNSDNFHVAYRLPSQFERGFRYGLSQTGPLPASFSPICPGTVQSSLGNLSF